MTTATRPSTNGQAIHHGRPKSAPSPNSQAMRIVDMARRCGRFFSLEELAVRAWLEWPGTFGLKGYSDMYPDFNKVSQAVHGQRGLRKRGYLTKVGTGLWQLRQPQPR